MYIFIKSHVLVHALVYEYNFVSWAMPRNGVSWNIHETPRRHENAPER